MKRFWQWLTRPFRRKKKPVAPAVPDYKRLNFHSVSPSHHRESDFVDGMLTYMVVDSAMDSLVGRSEAIDVPPQPEVGPADQVFNTVTVEHAEPVFNDTAGTTFNDTSSFSFGSSAPSAVDEDSLLTTVFSGIGDAVSGVGEAIGSALSD